MLAFIYVDVECDSNNKGMEESSYILYEVVLYMSYCDMIHTYGKH
jgi:hypothetical protein